MMERLALAGLLLCSACGGKGATAEEPENGQAAVVKAARTRLSIDITPSLSEEGAVDLILVLTDENGAAERKNLGAFGTSCRPLQISTGDDATAGELLRFDCRSGDGDAGQEVRFVRRNWDLFVLVARYDLPSDERSFEQRGSHPLPPGEAIEVDARPGDGAEGDPSESTSPESDLGESD